jgi:uncharacterized protein YjiS (DUF1127 family)
MQTQNCTHSISLQSPIATTKTSVIVRLLDCLALWHERACQRAALASLDDRLLADIGCDRATARTEADKPFWRP